MLAVIGCGNSTRSDDGVGVFIAQRLQTHLNNRPRADVRVFDAGTGGMEVMFHARGMRKLILMDAAKSGAQPGAIFKVPGTEFNEARKPAYSLHDFRWEHALAAGRLMFREQFPSDITVYLIEAQSLGFGLELSAAVSAAAEQVIADIGAIIDTYDAR
jgi:hydrogenase maturation protease